MIHLSVNLIDRMSTIYSTAQEACCLGHLRLGSLHPAHYMCRYSRGCVDKRGIVRESQRLFLSLARLS